MNALAPITATQRATVPLDNLLGLRGFELEAVEGVVSCFDYIFACLHGLWRDALCCGWCVHVWLVVALGDS